MKQFNVVTGVPRSGSTLLCNILNQNPDFHASDTSPVPEILAAMVAIFSHSDEIRGALAIDQDSVQERLKNMVEGVINAWHPHDKIVFDKSRGWSFNASLLTYIYPSMKFIITTRDLRGVAGSIEKQHRKTPMFDQAMNPLDKSLFARNDKMLSPEGLVGQCSLGLVDLMHRAPGRVFVVKFEGLTQDPGTTMRELYQFLGIEYYKHDFKEVKNVSHEPDALWHNKFPHQGSGEVTPSDRDEWKQYLPEDLGQAIYSRYPDYNKLFGY